MLKKKIIAIVLSVLMLGAFLILPKNDVAEAASCQNISLSIYSQNLTKGEVVFKVTGNPGNSAQIQINKFAGAPVNTVYISSLDAGANLVSVRLSPGYYEAIATQSSPCASSSTLSRFGM